MEQFEKGEAISDKGLAQLEHAFDMAYYRTTDPALRAAIEQQKQTFLNSIRINQVQQNNSKELQEPLSLNNKTKDGYVVLGKQAYGSKEAPAILKNTKGNYPNPLPYPTNPNLDKRHYPDVTKKVNGLLKQIEKEIDSLQGNPIAVLAWFRNNLDNNKNWDLQVNHGLPGQAPVIQDGKYIRNNQGYIKTRDQHGIFKGNITRAGYISNYAFGYASAHAGFPEILPIVIAQGLAEKGRKDSDNPDDLQAIKEGWEAYWQTSSED